MSLDNVTRPIGHIAQELGMSLRMDAGELHGKATVVPEMHVPGTGALRTSILAMWVDVIAGLLVGQVIKPRVPVTLELAVDLYRRAVDCGEVRAAGKVLKAGKSVVNVRADVSTADGEPLALGMCSFMAAPDVSLSMPDIQESLQLNHIGGGRLTKPFAERVACERTAPGVASLPRIKEGLNSSNTINGGLIALAVEEAVLSQAPGGTLSSLVLRYLRPARIGPAVATADIHGNLATVEVRDAGNEDRLAVVATARID